MANKKRIKKRNILICIIAIIIVYTLIISIFYKKKSEHFEYIIDGKAYRSDYCYSNDDQITFCYTANGIIEVDGYYTTN